MDRFKVGDRLKAKAGKYKGRMVEVTKVNNNPFIYECTVVENGISIALWEEELETVWDHDMRAFALWQKIKGEKSGISYCIVHREIELTEEIEDDGEGNVSYYTTPCPACMLDTRYNTRREVQSEINSLFQH